MISAQIAGRADGRRRAPRWLWGLLAGLAFMAVAITVVVIAVLRFLFG